MCSQTLSLHNCTGTLSNGDPRIRNGTECYRQSPISTDLVPLTITEGWDPVCLPHIGYAFDLNDGQRVLGRKEAFRQQWNTPDVHENDATCEAALGKLECLAAYTDCADTHYRFECVKACADATSVCPVFKNRSAVPFNRRLVQSEGCESPVPPGQCEFSPENPPTDAQLESVHKCCFLSDPNAVCTDAIGCSDPVPQKVTSTEIGQYHQCIAICGAPVPVTLVWEYNAGSRMLASWAVGALALLVASV